MNGNILTSIIISLGQFCFVFFKIRQNFRAGMALRNHYVHNFPLSNWEKGHQSFTSWQKTKRQQQNQAPNSPPTQCDLAVSEPLLRLLVTFSFILLLNISVFHPISFQKDFTFRCSLKYSALYMQVSSPQMPAEGSRITSLIAWGSHWQKLGQ